MANDYYRQENRIFERDSRKKNEIRESGKEKGKKDC